MRQSIAITGGTGFIGSAIVRELLAQGFDVTVLVRLDSDLTRLASIEGVDILSYSSLSSIETRKAVASRRPIGFIHCAWRGVAGRDRNETFHVNENISMTLDSVELAATSKCQQWIGLGSQAEYGNQDCRLNENAPARPTTLYGEGKLASGLAATALCEAHGMIGTWCRVFSAYGPGDAPYWFIPYVIKEFLANRRPALTKCEQQWDYLFVHDVARAIIALLTQHATGIFNIGTGSSRPLTDYVEAIRAELGSSLLPNYGAIPYRCDQVMHLEADTSKLRAQTGWLPQVDLRDGIRETVAFELSRATRS